MSFLLSAATQFDSNAQFGEEGGYMTVGEVLKNGGQYFLLGILAVFAVLGFIWIAIELFHRFCSAIPAKKAVEQDSVPVPVTRDPVAPIVSDAPVAQMSNDAEVVAAIMAAIEAATAEVPNGKFRVVSFRKK